MTTEKDGYIPVNAVPLTEKNRQISKQRDYIHYSPLFRKPTPKYSTVDVFVIRA